MRGETRSKDPVELGAPGASLFVFFSVNPGETKVIRLMMASILFRKLNSRV